jgi:hypothetical protein
MNTAATHVDGFCTGERSVANSIASSSASIGAKAEVRAGLERMIACSPFGKALLAL